MLMANQQSAELTKPCVGALYDPTPSVSPEFSSVFVAPGFVVLPIGHDQINATLFEPLAQRIGIVSAVSNYALGLLPRAALWSRHTDFGKRGFRKCSFSRRGTFEPNSQRKTLTVDQYHPLRALATLGFTDCGAPFFAGAKLPSRKVSSHLSRPSPSSAPSRVRHASSQTPSSSHCFRRRQQVDGEGNSSGRKRHAAPVCRIQRMPSKHARLHTHGLPRLSRRRIGGGNNGSIKSHCSSDNSFCRFFFMTEAHQITRLTRKYLI
jgi:hypothetical protein